MVFCSDEVNFQNYNVWSKRTNLTNTENRACTRKPESDGANRSKVIKPIFFVHQIPLFVQAFILTLSVEHESRLTGVYKFCLFVWSCSRIFVKGSPSGVNGLPSRLASLNVRDINSSLKNNFYYNFGKYVIFKVLCSTTNID